MKKWKRGKDMYEDVIKIGDYRVGLIEFRQLAPWVLKSNTIIQIINMRGIFCKCAVRGKALYMTMADLFNYTRPATELEIAEHTGQEYAIHCPTRKLFDKIIKAKGYERVLVGWDIFEENTCINNQKWKYDSKKYYIETTEFLIIPAEQWLAKYEQQKPMSVFGDYSKRAQNQKLSINSVVRYDYSTINFKAWNSQTKSMKNAKTSERSWKDPLIKSSEEAENKNIKSKKLKEDIKMNEELKVDELAAKNIKEGIKTAKADRATLEAQAAEQHYIDFLDEIDAIARLRDTADLREIENNKKYAPIIRALKPIKKKHIVETCSN